MATRVTSTRFVGRETELGELRAALAEARAGRPGLAFVAGESGVGKTRLVAELEAGAVADGVRVLHGDCVDLGEGELAYAPLSAALRPLARGHDPLLDDLSPGGRDALAGVLPGLGAADVRRAQPDEAEGARARLFEALLELLDRLGEDDGLLLVVEDLHWADRSTRAFLTFLAAALLGERVLVVGTYRADELHRRHPLRPLLAELERSPCVRRLELARLTRPELAEQLAGIVGDAPADELLDRLWRRSEGNPLFAEELLAAGTDGRGAAPPTLRDALMLRIERLSPAAQEAVGTVAVGSRLEHATVAAVAELDPARLRSALREAVAAQILVVDDCGRYAFRHALLREVVLDDLLPGERADAHLRLARALEAEAPTGAQALAEVAYHFAAAGEQTATLRASVVAGIAAERVHAYGEAGVLYERALELWDRVPDAEAQAGVDRVDLLRGAAHCFRTIHDPGRAATHLRAALAEVDEAAEPLRAARVLERLGAVQWMLGQLAESRASKDRGLELLGDGGPRAERAAILATTAKELMLSSRYREATTVAREALAEARAAGAAQPEIRALDALGIALTSTGEPGEGLELLREAIRLAAGEDMPMTMLTSYSNLSDASTIAGRLDDGRDVAQEGIAVARSLGHESRWLQLQAAELALLAGDFQAAAAAMPDRSRRSMRGTFLNDSLRRADLALGRGDHDAVADLLAETAELAAESRQPQFIGPYAVEAAELARRAGDLEAARDAIDDGLDRIELCSDDAARVAMVAAMGVRVEADAALRASDLGDAEAERLAGQRAEDLFARVEAIAAAGQPVEGARLGAARAAAARAAGADDPDLWTAAADGWAALGYRYDAALARLGAVEARLAAGERDAAAGEAATTLAEALAMGADWLADEVAGLAARARLRLEAEDDPATADGTTAAAADEDPFGLTARERQVLERLAAGRTNREIGAELFMAEKTASVHVSRILAKLDVRSRTEAAAVAHRLGLT